MSLSPIDNMMTPQQRVNFEFAMGHPRRVLIVEVLHGLKDGLSYEALSLATDISDALLDKHLQFLKDAGLIHLKLKGRFKIFKLDAMQFENIIGPCDIVPDDIAA